MTTIPSSGEYTSVPAQMASGEVDVMAFVRTLWKSWLFITIVTLLGAGLSVFVAMALPNVYRADAVLVPANDAGGGLEGLAGRFGGLASLAGLSLPEGGDSGNAQIALQILRSRAFIGDFIARQDMLVPLVASTGWDRETDTLELDPDLYDATAERWVREVGPPLSPEPSRLEAYGVFMELLTVEEDLDAGTVRLGLEHYSPKLASAWLGALIDALNEELRRADVERARRSIEYLQRQIATTALAEMRSVFYELIQSHTETIMLAEASPEYVFRVIDPAVVPEQPVRPMRVVIVVIGVFTAFLIAILIVAAREVLATARADESA